MTLPSRRAGHVTSECRCLFWHRGTVVRTSVFGWRTFPTCAWSTVDGWPLCEWSSLSAIQVNQPGQFILPFLRVGEWVVIHVKTWITGIEISMLVYRSLFGPALPGWWLSAVHRRSSKTTAFRWHEDTVSKTGILQLLPPEFRTVCHQTDKKQSYHTPGSVGRWSNFYLDSPTTAHCELY